jgi:hypothetical protein
MPTGCAGVLVTSLVLVLNEMVLVLEVLRSSTSTACAEYEYEKTCGIRFRRAKSVGTIAANALGSD